jgi:biotin carboxyl carrier protein
MTEKNEMCALALEGGTYETRPTPKFLRRKPFEPKNARVIRALIPGVVAEIGVTPGQAVRKGETLMILEAMKMLNRIAAPADGRVKSFAVAAGEKVSKGQVLVELA